MAIAVPTLEKEWQLDPTQLQWIISAYPLSSVSSAAVFRYAVSYLFIPLLNDSLL